MPHPADPHRDFVKAVLARDALRALARLLDGHGIPVMPLKGVLLQRIVYEDDPARRPLCDVDVLVPDGDYPRVRRILRGAGYRFRSQPDNLMESSHVAPNGMVIDLHRRLFGRGRFRMPTAEVFGRARRDTALFDAPVWVPDPRDLFAHLIGHFSSARMNRSNARELREMAFVAERLALDPAAMAAHFEACGLRRAARYVLPLVGEAAGHRFSGAVLDALPADPVGEALARGARAVMGPTGLAAAVAGHLLNRSLPAAAVSAALAVASRAQKGLRRGSS